MVSRSMLGARAGMQEITRIISFILKFPDAALNR
jgi:hypothetical protein